MLLDCGEGTYGQLRRRYGAASDEIIGALKCIWISHIHADHHAGLGRSVAPCALSRRDFCTHAYWYSVTTHAALLQPMDAPRNSHVALIRMC